MNRKVVFFHLREAMEELNQTLAKGMAVVRMAMRNFGMLWAMLITI